MMTVRYPLEEKKEKQENEEKEKKICFEIGENHPVYKIRV